MLAGPLVEETLRIGVIVVVVALGRIILDKAVAQAHGHVGIAVVGILLVHLQQRLREQMLVVGNDFLRLGHTAVEARERFGEVLGIHERGVGVAQC